MNNCDAESQFHDINLHVEETSALVDDSSDEYIKDTPPHFGHCQKNSR